MTEWGVVVVLITLGTFGIAVVRPIITLTSTITTLTAVVEQLRADVKEQSTAGRATNGFGAITTNRTSKSMSMKRN